MIELQEIFDVSYGNKFDLNKMVKSEFGINFIGRTAKNNGTTAVVEEIANVTPYSSGCITVALGGSVLSSFLQPKAFYTGQNVAVLEAKSDMTDAEKLFYCHSIQSNAYRFSTCGREANRFLRALLLPSFDEIPAWVKQTDIHKYDDAKQVASPAPTPALNTKNWKPFQISQLFDSFLRGKCENAPALLEEGNDISYIGAKKSENGVMRKAKHNPKITFSGNSLVFITNGQGSVGFALYQPHDFIASSDVIVAYSPRLNPFIGLFLVTVLDLERYRYSFGRKYGKARIMSSKIKLPVDSQGHPDWQFMGDYIKSLPYSANF